MTRVVTWCLLDGAGSLVDAEPDEKWAATLARQHNIADDTDPHTGVRVSTKFFGVRIQPVFGPPWAFETMVFSKHGRGLVTIRYATLADAQAGHAKAVQTWITPSPCSCEQS